MEASKACPARDNPLGRGVGFMFAIVAQPGSVKVPPEWDEKLVDSCRATGT